MSVYCRRRRGRVTAGGRCTGQRVEHLGDVEAPGFGPGHKVADWDEGAEEREVLAAPLSCIGRCPENVVGQLLIVELLDGLVLQRQVGGDPGSATGAVPRLPILLPQA